MTRAETLAEYKVITNGEACIVSPGKFQNTRIYVPHLWQAVLDGGADPDEAREGYFRVGIIDADRIEYPELRGIESVTLYESNDGFVCEVAIVPIVNLDRD